VSSQEPDQAAPALEPSPADLPASLPANLPADQERLSVRQIALSTVAAAFGVQKRANKERDFAQGKPLHFVIAGIIFTALFVVTIIVIVNVVLS
jgi:hypothetical protein